MGRGSAAGLTLAGLTLAGLTLAGLTLAGLTLAGHRGAAFLVESQGAVRLTGHPYT